MKLPTHKTKIVCTIGPACQSLSMIEKMIESGMDVARINFSHARPDEIRRHIKNITTAAQMAGKTVAILGDLPGAKIRLGDIPGGLRLLKKGEKIVLTTDLTAISPSTLPVEYKQLTKSVLPGSTIFINDGFIQLRVEKVARKEVHCVVIVGGTVMSHKGLNLPGAKLFVDCVTKRDLELIDIGLDAGVDMFAVSFIESAADIIKVKKYARRRGRQLFTVAKIERAQAVKNIDEILSVTDAVMVARGDLGVEMPLEKVPIIQKQLIFKANAIGRPVITATQMLESMKNNTRPTRAEVTDVANAIIDGTDAVMLSEETAIGEYPTQTVSMMAAIALETERQRENIDPSCDNFPHYSPINRKNDSANVADVISHGAVTIAEELRARYVLTPTETGNTPRRVSRYRPLCWVLAFSRFEKTVRQLSVSRGVQPFKMAANAKSWHKPIMEFLSRNDLTDDSNQLVIVEGRHGKDPGGTDSIEILTVSSDE